MESNDKEDAPSSSEDEEVMQQPAVHLFLHWLFSETLIVLAQ